MKPRVIHLASTEERYKNLLLKGKWYTVFKTNSHAIACVLAFSPMQACEFIAKNTSIENAESFAMGMLHAIPVNASVSIRRYI